MGHVNAENAQVTRIKAVQVIKRIYDFSTIIHSPIYRGLSRSGTTWTTHLFITIITLFTILLIGLAGCTGRIKGTNKPGAISFTEVPMQSSMARTVANPERAGLWVSGEGKAFAVPDIALLALGIEAQAESVSEAQTIARQAMGRVREALREQGIEEKDIRTTSYNIQPVYQWLQRENRQEIIGYRVSDRISVKIRKIQDAGKAIDASVQAGGDYLRIYAISFTIEDPTPYKNEARERAVKDAMAKAGQMAELAGVKLGKALYINETEGIIAPPPRPVPVPLAESRALAAPTEISPGETEIKVRVQMAFSIE